MSEVKANICSDHQGTIEKFNVILRDIKSYYSLDTRTYVITFARDDNSIYSSLEFTKYAGVNKFFKIENAPIQMGRELNIVYQRALSSYKSGIRDEKLIEIGIV